MRGIHFPDLQYINFPLKEEIARIMNYANENAAKSTNYRCKQKLISLVEGASNLKFG